MVGIEKTGRGSSWRALRLPEGVAAVWPAVGALEGAGQGAGTQREVGVGVSGGLWAEPLCLSGVGTAIHPGLLLGSQGLHLLLGGHTRLSSPTPPLQPDVSAKISLENVGAARETVMGIAPHFLSEVVSRTARHRLGTEWSWGSL